MKNLLVALGAALGCILMGAAPAFAQAPAPNTVAPGVASGTPTVTSLSTYGYYLWIDGNQIHLRTTDPGGDASEYTGKITTDGQFRDVNLIQPEDTDWAVGDNHKLDFHFVTHNRVDGVSFTAAGATRVTFHLFRNGHEIRTDHIFLGGGGMHPPGNPFTLFV